MELTAEQETDVQKLMAQISCPRNFACYESKFEDITPVRVISDNAIECFKAKEFFCQMSISFGMSTMLCRCPLRRYVALNLGR